MAGTVLMAGMLAFDPERVRVLREGLAQAGDDLRVLRAGGPLAEFPAAMALVARAANVINGWPEWLGRLLTCGVMDDYTPFAIPADRLQDPVAHVMAALYGWAVVTDPGEPGTSAAVVGAEARALGWRLAHEDLALLLDSDAEVAYLDEAMQRILGDPAAIDDFLANLGGDGLARLLDALAIRREEHLRAGEPAEADGRAIGQLAPLLQHGAPVPLDTLTPGALAAAIPHLRLSDDDLGRWAFAAVSGWWDGGGTVDALGPPTLADELFHLVATRPGAAAVLIRAIGPDAAYVGATCRDWQSAVEVVIAGTDPRVLATADAGTFLKPFLQDTLDPARSGGNTAPPYAVGAVVAPWLLSFTTRADDWAWSADDGMRTLAVVLRDGTALDDVLGATSAWAPSSADADVDAAAARRQLADVVGMLACVNRLVADEQAADAGRARAVWDVTWTVGGTVVVALATATMGPVAGVASELGADNLLMRARAFAERRGLPLAPPTPAMTEADADRRVDVALCGVQYSAVALAFAVLGERGAVAGDAPNPPGVDAGAEHPSLEYRVRLEAWFDRIRRTDPAAAEWLAQVADQVGAAWLPWEHAA